MSALTREQLLAAAEACERWPAGGGVEALRRAASGAGCTMTTMLMELGVKDARGLRCSSIARRLRAAAEAMEEGT